MTKQRYEELFIHIMAGLFMYMLIAACVGITLLIGSEVYEALSSS